MDAPKRSTLKVAAAVIGGSAMVTMGALSMSIHQQPSGSTANVAVAQLTLGATATESGKDDTTVATSMAVPAIKGPAPLPTEEKAAE